MKLQRAQVMFIFSIIVHSTLVQSYMCKQSDDTDIYVLVCFLLQLSQQLWQYSLVWWNVDIEQGMLILNKGGASRSTGFINN